VTKQERVLVICDDCEEAPACVIASVTTLNGVLLESAHLCAECARSGAAFLVPTKAPWVGRFGQVEQEAMEASEDD